MVRPRIHDREHLAQELVLWAQLPDSLNLNAFCTSRSPMISAVYLLQMVDEDAGLAEAYSIAQACLATRREEANAAKELTDAAYKCNLRVYDKINHKQWKDELKFEKALDKETANEAAKVSESKFSEVIDQLAGFSRSNRKIDASSTNSDTKS